MKAKDLLDSIGTVDEDLLERSETAGAEQSAEEGKIKDAVVSTGEGKKKDAEMIKGAEMITDVEKTDGEEASTGGKKNSGRSKITRLRSFIRRPAAVIAAAVLIVAGILLYVFVIKPGKGGDPILKKFMLAEAAVPKLEKQPSYSDYPDTDEGMAEYQAAYRAWDDAKRKLYFKLIDYGKDKAAAAVDQFTFQSMQAVLTDRNGENRVYSPMNVYLLLGMLAETTGGNSRDQILSLLGADSIEDMRARADALWCGLYRTSAPGDIEQTKCILGSSMWLSTADKRNYIKKTLDRLANSYHASTFMGEMGSKAYNEALQRWINLATDGMLEDSVKNVGLDSDTVIALATTICYVDQWFKKFNTGETSDEVFHAEAGDKTVPFMHDVEGGDYYRGTNFTAVRKTLNESAMWFILPDDGVSVDEVMENPELKNIMSVKKEELQHAIVHMGVPKFDVTCSTDLRKALTKLGVSDIFSPGKSDFSSLMDGGSGYYVSEIKHSVRLVMDEDGVKAAAYTEGAIAAAVRISEDELYITFNRPFLFLVEGEQDCLPLFAGVVENP